MGMGTTQAEKGVALAESMACNMNADVDVYMSMYRAGRHERESHEGGCAHTTYHIDHRTL